MVTTPDDRIGVVAAQLAASGRLRRGDIVFHCSGSLSSAELADVRGCGAYAASVHPLKTFADPAAAAAQFDGTACAIEGDASAVAKLSKMFTHCGARVITLEARRKTLYHAAAVLASNDLVVLLEAVARCAMLAGVAKSEALRLFEPLVHETVDNVFRLGTDRALTGPVVRGDAQVIARQTAALAKHASLSAIYRALGLLALELAQSRGTLKVRAARAVKAALSPDPVRPTPPRSARAATRARAPSSAASPAQRRHPSATRGRGRRPPSS